MGARKAGHLGDAPRFDPRGLCCPHCGQDFELAVQETRKGAQAVYRARVCGGCETRFISRETTEPGLKMPEGRQTGRKGAQRAPKPADFSGLTQAWQAGQLTVA